jgi:hypothetical protein
MAVPVTPTPPVKLGVPVKVFEEEAQPGVHLTQFDVARDGRLLMTRSTMGETANVARLVLIQTWRAALPG